MLRILCAHKLVLRKLILYKKSDNLAVKLMTLVEEISLH